jgi:diguanylate cyclase (GGDEF)-like protein
MKSPIKILAILLSLQFYFYLAECPAVFGQYRFDSWTTDNGLPQNGVRQITQTPDGYLWFTTFDGLVRFDGVQFTTFGKGNTKGIINNRFTGVYCDKDGTLYATTIEDGTLSIFRNGVFSSYKSEEVPGHYIEHIKPDKNGELRFQVVEGNNYERSLYYLRNGEFVLSETVDRNPELIEYQGKSGTLWTLTADQITALRNGTPTVYNYRIEKFDFTREAFEDSQGGLWIGGPALVRLHDGQIETFEGKMSFPKNADFHWFWEESDGSVWFANGGRAGPGLGLIRYKNGQLSSFGKPEGLSDASIYCVFKDREGVVWLATNKGLNRLRKKVIKTFNADHGLNSSEVYPIYRDRRDNIWIGTTRGLNLYRDGKFEPVALEQSDPTAPEFMKWKDTEMTVQALLEDRAGKMWIGVSGGIFIAENGRTEMLRDSRGQHVSAIREDSAGNVWVTGSKGVLLYRDYRLQASYTTADGLPNNFMTVVFEDSRGRLWFGGFGGLSEFKDGKFINHTTVQGLTGNYVRSIYEDRDGTLWIGTYGEGLSRFKDGRFTTYKAENGLYNNDVFAIQEDARGDFWISSNRGIYRVSRRELNDFADGKIDKINSVGYGKEDGMLNNECNGGRQPASITDRDGKFWFPTQDGVVVVDSQHESSNPLPPSVVIESATVEREAVNISQGLTIEPGQKNIEIKFTGISLIKSEQIKFKYKLEGVDPDWVNAGTRRAAYYSYLPPGNYQFRVRAANSDGVWNEEGARLGLDLKSYFYQTNEFYLLCLTVGVFALFIVWKISVYQLESRERRLAKLVSEKTEELKKANDELRHLANSDGLTKIGNRRRFEHFLADEWHRAVRFKTEISLILLDIDHFKLFNDHYGHQAGDECLQKVAEALAGTIHRPTDLVARFGGEEFAIVLGGTDSEGAVNIAKQAMESIKNLQIPHGRSKTGDHLTISLGVATIFPKFETTEADLIKAADETLYRSKENGRNQINAIDLSTRIVQKSMVLEEEFAGLT